MKKSIKNKELSPNEKRNVFVGAKVTRQQKEHIRKLADKCGMTVSSYVLARACDFCPKARLTQQEEELLQNLDNCRADLVNYTSALHGMNITERKRMFNSYPFMLGWLKELGKLADRITAFMDKVKSENKTTAGTSNNT